jgi:hypothetical protein
MKTYNNGPRKGMMYGGMTRRKPMMYGGTANQMSAKKAKGQQMPREERKSKNVEPAMGMPKMAGGGKAKFPDLNKDGKVTKADILKGRGVI